jgi:hypothetical protein
MASKGEVSRTSASRNASMSPQRMFAWSRVLSSMSAISSSYAVGGYPSLDRVISGRVWCSDSTKLGLYEDMVVDKNKTYEKREVWDRASN